MGNNLVLGFRAEPTCIHWALVSGSIDAPVLDTHDEAAAPVNQTEAQQLTWYRDRVLLLIETHRPGKVAVRFAEAFRPKGAKGDSGTRSRIEGVILEAANSVKLPVITGALKTISSRLGSQSAKKYLESDDLRGLDWSSVSKNSKEAILIAAAALGEVSD